MVELAKAESSAWRSYPVQALLILATVAGVLGAGIYAAVHVSRSVDQLVIGTGTARLQALAAHSVFSDLQDAETGQRGYLLTQRPYYLDPFHQASAHLEVSLARLKLLGRGTPWLEEDGEVLAAAARRKMTELNQTIEVAHTQGIAAAMQTVLTDAGKQYMDEARAVATRIVDRAELERSQRAALLQSRQGALSAVTLTGLGAGLLLLGAAALVLLWSRDRLVRAERGQRLEAARLQSAVEHGRDGVAVFDGEQRLTLINSRFAATLGLPEQLAAPGVTLTEIAAALTLDPPLLDNARAGQHPFMTEARLGERVLEIWRSAMPEGGQMVALSDVSRRVQAEEIARQGQKMEVLGQMTGGIAHDFNNLLQIVSANLELVTDKIRRNGDDASVLAQLDAASAGVARGARLTRHLLAFARRQPLAPEAIDAGRLLMGMEDMLRRTLGEAIQLEMVIGGGLWAMRADPSQMESALLNLALNARDAMVREDGIAKGRLTIEVLNTALDDGYAATRLEVLPGQYLMFAVTDTGAGMTPEQVARATEPFYTTKPDGKGTGLGLPMVYGFAKQSGGHFQLYSEPGQGTTARLYIPRTSATIAAPAPPSPDIAPAAGELVLLVEDEPAVRRAAAATLQSLGYTVQEAGDADAALMLLKNGCKPALLFSDVVMPGAINARELAIRAQNLVPGIAVLFTSGYTQNAIVHNGQLDPGVNLISKPWRTEELGHALRAALEGVRRPRPPPRPQRVLLVEDEALVRMTTADALAEMGYEVLEAATGRAALERMHHAPDLVLTDLGLPDMDGYELVAQIRARAPDIPIVIASGAAETSNEGMGWLRKPYHLQELKSAVRRALADH